MPKFSSFSSFSPSPFIFELGSHYVAWASLKLTQILLPLYLLGARFKSAPPCLAL